MFKILKNILCRKSGKNVVLNIDSGKGFIKILWLKKINIDGRIFYKVKDCANSGFIKKGYNLMFETGSLREGDFNKLIVHVLNERFMAIFWYYKIRNVEVKFI